MRFLRKFNVREVVTITILIHGYPLEILLEVFEAHPGGTVIGVLEVKGLFDFGSPERTRVTPVSIPFKPTPGVPKQDQFMSMNLFGVNKRVVMR